MTGWTLPERSEVVGQKGESGIPWMNVAISTVEARDVESRGSTLNPMGGTFNFYVRNGKEMEGRQAVVSYTGIEMGKEFWVRGSAALDMLLANYSTVGAHGAGAPGGGQGVDLRTFTDAAKSFDAAGDFFAKRTELIKQWAEGMGSEKAAWKGTAADVFRILLEKMHAKYENYTAQLRPPGFNPGGSSPSTSYTSTTLHGDSLVDVERSLYRAYEQLFQAHYNFYWQQGKQIEYEAADGAKGSANYPADPRDILNQLMADVARWIERYNWGQANWQSYEFHMQYENHSSTQWSVGPEFSSSPKWGNLADTSTWASIADEATRRWTYNVQYNLDEPARTVVTEVSAAWNRSLDPKWNTRFAFTDNGSTSLSEDVRTAQAEEAAESAQKQQEEFAKGLTNNGNNFNEGLEKFGNQFGQGLNNFGENFGNNLENAFGGGEQDGGGGLPKISTVSGPEGTTSITGSENGGSTGAELPNIGTPGGVEGATPVSTSSGPEGTTSVSPGGLLADPGAVGGLGALGGLEGATPVSTSSGPEGTTSVSPGGPLADPGAVGG
ncbi:AAWKG family protein, partial [Streptomyces sp. NPDC002911]